MFGFEYFIKCLTYVVERFSSTLVENRTESNLIPTPDLSIYRLRSGYPYPVPGENGVNEDGFLVSQNSTQDLCFQVSNLLSQVQQLKEEYKVVHTIYIHISVYVKQLFFSP